MSTLNNLAIAGLFAGAVAAGGAYLWNNRNTPDVQTTHTTTTTKASSETDICAAINNAPNPERAKRHYTTHAKTLITNGRVLKSPMTEARGQALKAEILAC